MTLRPFKLILVLIAFASWLTPICAGQIGQIIGGPAGPQTIYLLGLDTSESGQMGKRLLRSIEPNSADSWALTAYARDFANSQSLENIALSNVIQQWDPETDPFNFAAISVRDVFWSQSTWETGDTKVYVTINMLWMNVGHEIGTRYADEKVPELRSAISEFSVLSFSESVPPSEQRLNDMLKESFDRALSDLLSKVDLAQGRQAQRSLTDSYYVTVTPALLSDSVAETLRNFFSEADLKKQLPKLLSTQIESSLISEISSDSSLDSVVLLPNPETLELVSKEWPKFAARANSLGIFASPLADKTSLLRIKPICEASNSGWREVEGVEVRSAIMAINHSFTEFKPGIEIFEISTLVASNLKLPLNANKSEHLSVDRSNLSERYSQSSQVPAAIKRTFFFSPDVISDQLTNVANQLAKPLVTRLKEVLHSYPRLNHPTLLEKCV